MERNIVFSNTEQPLREDVGLLGAMVGDVLQEQVGQSFFELIERIRKAAIERREQQLGDTLALTTIVGELSPADANNMVRAFSAYFQVVNLAEQVHRIRRRREYEAAGAPSAPGGMQQSLQQLKELGLTAHDIEQGISKLLLEPVFTAHPTEAVRRTMLEKEKRIADALIRRLDTSLTPRENAALKSQMRMHIAAAWQTAEYSGVRPSVAEEREHVLFYLTDVVYGIIPSCYEAVRRALQTEFTEYAFAQLPVFLRFGSWVGGDMDGNPNVTAQTLRESLQAQRGLIMQRYAKEIAAIAPLLSQSISRVNVSSQVVAQLAQYKQMMPVKAKALPLRYEKMVYRQFLMMMSERLLATHNQKKGAYVSPEHFVNDLQLITQSLKDNQGGRAGLHIVNRLLWRARTFGFHLASLDVRQHAMVHREAVALLLSDKAWLSHPLLARVAALQKALLKPTPLPIKIPRALKSVLDVFSAISLGRLQYGEKAVGVFIISMAESAEDVLSVLLLARSAGCVDEAGNVNLDIAPLFETVEDLQNAPQVMQELLSLPEYRSHLAQRPRGQMVMLGYSDSSKDGGLAASRWTLQYAQEALMQIASVQGIELSFFHGRGGSISRGGSKTEKAIAASPAGSLKGTLRITEQGEVIHRKFGIRAIALRSLEQTYSALIRNALHSEAEPAAMPKWREVMQDISAHSRKAYRAFVFEHPKFIAYFRDATPIDVIEHMRIGSRPSARKKNTKSVSQLRAIPWVFAWSQSRHGLPGWFGLGQGLQFAIEKHGLATLQTMAEQWPFFQTLLEDAEMVLAKSDMPIAKCYSELSGDLHEIMFPIVEGEFDLTLSTILKIRKSSSILEQDPKLQRTLRLRNPYVDPLSLLQVDLLRRWRASAREDAALFEALVNTVSGIARGLRNTG